MLATLLALSPARSLSRQQLLSLLWPGEEPETARSHLRDTLYRARIMFGERTLYAHDNEIRIDPGFVRCDVWEFETGVARGDWETALRWYRGPLLGDPLPAMSYDLQRLVIRERIRLADLQAHAQESLLARGAFSVAARTRRLQPDLHDVRHSGNGREDGGFRPLISGPLQ